jgi:hypothetical protein
MERGILKQEMPVAWRINREYVEKIFPARIPCKSLETGSKARHERHWSSHLKVPRVNSFTLDCMSNENICLYLFQAPLYKQREGWSPTPISLVTDQVLSEAKPWSVEKYLLPHWDAVLFKSELMPLILSPFYMYLNHKAMWILVK